jgi:2-hydroxy-3-keto-5-methylthiopentenyl-1-phosphate phosphatase
MSDSPPTGLFVTDFDGTMTETDFYQLALERFTPSEAQYVWERYLRGELTLFETLQGIFSAIQSPEQEVAASLVDLGFDPQAAGAIGRLRQSGWDVVVASSGCEWYVRRVLAAAGINAVLHTNPGGFAESGGLEMRMPTNSPFFSDWAGISKAAIVRDALERFPVVAFAGDSTPDYEAAKLVPAGLRFARSHLAEHLEREGLEYRRYRRWSEIADMLLTPEAS